MITAGLDVGAQNVKVAIVRDGQILAEELQRLAMDRDKSARDALESCLQSAGLAWSHLGKIVATGAGRKHIDWATDSVTEISAVARGANHFFPLARTVVDVGAEECRAVKVDVSGKVVNFAKNDKCAAGVGSFVESMARALETTVEQMGVLSLQSDQLVPMNATCVVFAESEVVSLIHARTSKPDIARAIHNAMATRITSTMRRVGIEKDVVFIGGVAKNAGVVERVAGHLGFAPLTTGQTQFVTAVGAALIGESETAQAVNDA